MPDMLVRLYSIDENEISYEQMTKQGIKIKRVLSPDKHHVINFIKEHFHEGWASECEAAFTINPNSCFIAVKDKKILGFACYDATAKGFFGPTGVSDNQQGKGIGKALLIRTLLAMKEAGYGYAIIGGVGDAIPFYEKAIGATLIENSVPGIYSRLISVE